MHTPASNSPRVAGPGAAVEPALSQIQGATFALAVLFSMNLLNYMDRYVFNSLGRQIEADLRIDHKDFGWLAGAFMVVYSLVSPAVGWMGDRFSRRHLLAAGVGLWSLATVGTAFSTGFNQMFFWRALLGVGEASYGVVAPALLADLFARKARGRVMGWFYLAMPLGIALGFAVGGFVGHHYNWRVAFWVVGLPGLLAAALALLIRDPGRGPIEAGAATRDPRPGLADYATLFRNRSFLYNIAGLAAATFAIGAYGTFASIFYQEVRGMTLSDANLRIAVMAFFSGVIGILLGIVMADVFHKFTPGGYLLWTALAAMVATPFVGGGFLLSQPYLSMGSLFIGMILLSSVLGPCNTVVANVVPANQRAAGYAVTIFLIHMLGDISSPILIGYLSEWLGRPAVAASHLGRSLASMGAVAQPGQNGPTNLTAGLLLVVPMLALGAVFFYLGSRHLAGDQERAALLGGEPEDGETSFH